MVKKIFSFINKEISGLHEAAYLLGFFAFLSQLLALLRDRLLAHSFGAGHVLDIYYASFRIPDLVFVSIASIVSVSVLIPFLIEKFENDKENSKKFVDSVFSVFFLTIIFISVVLFFFVPRLVGTFFPGFSESQINDVIILTRILLLSPVLLGVSNFMGSITQVYNRFFVYALSPILYNFGIILGILFLYPLFGISGLAYGVIFGAFLHLMIQVPFVWGRGLFPSLVWRIDWTEIRHVVFVSLPRTVAVSSGEVSRFVLVGLASLVGVGSISVFTFSFNLQSVPLSIIGVSYSLAAFPMLTRYFTSGNRDKFIEQMVVSTRHILFLSVPVIALFVVLRAQIVRTVLGSGNFDWYDTRLTAAALSIFVLSLVPQGLVLLFARAYYACGNTKKPLFINVFSSLVIVLAGFVLLEVFSTWNLFRYFIESLFKVDDIKGSSVLMIALAYSFGMTVNMFLHWLSFERDHRGFSKRISQTFFDIFGASVITGFVAYIGLNVMDNFLDINTFFGIFFQGLVAGVVGLLFGVLVLLALRNKEIAEIWKTLHQKIWRAKAVSPDPEGV